MYTGKRKSHLRIVNGLGSASTDALAKSAAMAYFTGGASAAGGIGSGGSGGGAGAAPGNATTTISPNIQTQVSPQISPVFQQSSGGGSQTATTTQYTPGGQSGQGGSSMPPSADGSGGYPLNSGAPLPLVPTTGLNPYQPPLPFVAQQSSGGNWLMWGVAAAAIGLAVYMLWPDGKKAG